jgi:hypothetical protein
MAVGSLSLTRAQPNRWRLAAGGLILAAVIVAVAIIAGGPAARILNGIGALVWISSAIVLAMALPAPERRVAGWVAAVVAALLLGGVVRPSGISEVVVWFALAGAAVVLAAGDRSGGWALLVPAIYLPVHLVIGIGRAIARHGGMRTEPPPTAAIVPLAMVLAAAAAGALMANIVRRQRVG